MNINNWDYAWFVKDLVSGDKFLFMGEVESFNVIIII